MALCFPLGLGRSEGLAILRRRLHDLLGGIWTLLLLLLLLRRRRGRQRRAAPLARDARGRAGHGHVRRPSLLLLQGLTAEMWI